MVGFVHNDAVLRGLIDLCDDNRALIAVRLVKLGQRLEGKIANDVGIEHKKWLVIFAEDLLGELQRPSGTEGFCLNRELYPDVVLLLVLRESVWLR